MKKNGQIISVELCDCSSIENFKIRDEKNRFIAQGTDFCKIFDKIKGVDFVVDRDDHSKRTIIYISFDINQISQLYNYGKFISLMKIVQANSTIKYNKKNWKNIENISTNIQDQKKLEQFEKGIKIKKYCVYPPRSLNLNSDYLCVYNNESIDIIKKSERNIEYKKSIGGIIFDHDNNFLKYFNDKICTKTKSSKTKNIVMSDVYPRLQNEINFMFKHTRTLNSDTKLSTSRVILYYPTNDTILQLKTLIQSELLGPPRIIWIVVPWSEDLKLLNFNDVTNILFWNITDNICQNNIQLTSLHCKTMNASTLQYKNTINLEKVKYKLNENEESLILSDTNEINIENLQILDKICLSNFNMCVPKNVIDSDNCPVCGLDFNDQFNDPNESSKTYMPCGHVYCPSCLLSTLKIKHNCPICRKVAKFNNISIPNLTSNKIKYLCKLLRKIVEKYDNKNVLIYTDTVMSSRGIISHINSELCKNDINKKCIMIKPKSSEQNSAILVAPTDNNYLCQNIKNIKNVIILTNVNDHMLKPESMGYDFCYANEKVNVWLFEPDIR